MYIASSNINVVLILFCKGTSFVSVLAERTRGEEAESCAARLRFSQDHREVQKCFLCKSLNKQKLPSFIIYALGELKV